MNHLGTNPVHVHLAINNALDYIEWGGIKRKEKRLKELQNHWIQNLKNIPNIEIFDIKDLNNSNKSEITFYHSKKYKNIANITQASFCITSDFG